MPNRDLKESNRRSASLQMLSDAAERLWYRLITSVDDFGRMEADPEVVFNSCFIRQPKGWTIQKVEKCLQELCTVFPAGEQSMVIRYQVGSRWFLQIRSADQFIYKRAKLSKYPSPTASQMYSKENQQVTEIVVHPPADADRCAQIPSYPESRVPSPDPRIPSPESRSKTKETEKREPTAPQSVLSRLEAFALTPELEAWAVREGIAQPAQYLEEFKDYWRSVGGKRGNGRAIVDWPATFRNRLLELKSQGKLKSSISWQEKFLAAGEEAHA